LVGPIGQHHPTIANESNVASPSCRLHGQSKLPKTGPPDGFENPLSLGRTKRAAALAEFVPIVGADMSLIEDAA
jgi:hypothetical protein